MEIAQVETFLAVGTFGGFRRAAEALRVTQPAVSARIKALEASLGVRLFDRGPGGLRLSAAGRALRAPAERLLHTVALARQAVHDLDRHGGGAPPNAPPPRLCAHLLPPVLPRLPRPRPRPLRTVHPGP